MKSNAWPVESRVVRTAVVTSSPRRLARAKPCMKWIVSSTARPSAMQPVSSVKASMGIPVQPISPTVMSIAPMAGIMLRSPVRRLPSTSIMIGVMIAKASR